MASRVQITIEVAGEAQARQAVRNVQSALDGLGGTATQVNGPLASVSEGLTNGLDRSGDSLSNFAAEFRAKSAELNGQIGGLKDELSTGIPTAVGNSLGSLALLTGAFTALGGVLSGTLDAAIDAFARTEQGAESLANVARTAHEIKRAFGDEFRSEMVAATEAFEALVDVMGGAQKVGAFLAGALKLAIPPLLFLREAAENFTVALTELRALTGSPLEAIASLAPDQTKNIKRDVDAYAEATREVARLAAQRRAARVREEERAAEETARIRERAQGQLEQLELSRRRATANPQQALGLEFEQVVARLESLRGKVSGDAIEAELQAQIESFTQRAAALETELFASVDRQVEGILQRNLTGVGAIQERLRQQLEQLDLAEAQTGSSDDIDRARVAARERAEAEITAIHDREARERERIAEREAKAQLDAQQKIEDQVRSLERAATLARSNAFERIELERQESIDQIAANVSSSAEQIERARAAAATIAAGEIQEEQERIFSQQQQALDRQAREWELFWDRVTRGAKSTGDFLSNLWDETENQFRRMIFGSVSALLTGQQRVAGASANAGGGAGIFGGLGGLIFGGAGGASAATPPFVGNSFVNGFAAGGDPFAFGSIHTRGPAAGADLGGLAGVLNGGIAGANSPVFTGAGATSPLAFGLPGNPLLPLALGGLLGSAGASRGNPLLGGLLGAGGVLGGVAINGALAGAAGGIGALGGIGVGLAGFLTNPVGLAVLGGVAIASVIGGILARGRKKEEATEIANEGFTEIDRQIRAFELRQSNYVQTIDRMENVWDEMVNGWNTIGGSIGRNSILDQQQYYDARVRKVDDLQAARLTRGDALAGLPLPEFATGGLVGRPVLAKVHEGEFVVRKSAVDAIGVGALERMNRAPAFADGGLVGGLNLAGAGAESYQINFNVSAMDASGVQSFFEAQGSKLARFVVETVRREKRERGRI